MVDEKLLWQSLLNSYSSVTDVDEDIRTRTDIADDEKIKLYEERLMVNKKRA